MRRRRIAFVASALLLTAAQSAPLVVASKPIATMSADEALILFMQCSVRTKAFQQKWLTWSSFAPEDPRSKAQLRTVASDECMPVDHSGNVYALNISPVAGRGVLYNVLYKKTFGSDSPPGLSAVINADFAREFASSDAVAKIVTVRKLGDCVVSSDAATVHHLLVSKLDSDPEQRAFVELTPRLSACMPGGTQLRLPRSFVRGMLAEAAYKRAANIVQPFADKVGRN